MNTLTKLIKLNNNIIIKVKENIAPFRSFKQVFLFGSALKLNNTFNDIDILIIYHQYSKELNEDLILFSRRLENSTGRLVDITALSSEEMKEIDFLDKINSNYLKLK